MILSVIVPAYNVEKYLERCINSILNQIDITYEIIIINDGSTDSTGDIADRLKNKNDNIVVIHQNNKGIAETRNIGILNAKGKYIAFVDSDDYLKPNIYGEIFSLVDKDFDIVCYDMIKITESEHANDNDSRNSDMKIIKLNNEKAQQELFLNNITSYVCDKIFNINLFKKHNILFPKGKLYEDLQTSYRLIAKSEKIYKVNIKGYYYLQRINSITKNINKKNLDDFSSEYRGVLDIINNDEKIKKCNELITYKCIKYNSLIRMKTQLTESNYIIDESIKFKLPIKQIIFNRNLSINEKIINIIGDNVYILRMFINLYRKLS